MNTTVKEIEGYLLKYFGKLMEEENSKKNLLSLFLFPLCRAKNFFKNHCCHLLNLNCIINKILIDLQQGKIDK